MKYGYLLYQKPLISEMPSRPVNLGDPIQSYAVKLLYKEMGIKDEDIIPVPRYDIENYDGEECICVVNTCSTYEELAYDSHFMPPSDKVHAIPFSLHINREIEKREADFYRNCLDVGCRDTFTVNMLSALGANAYLTGCITLTFPRRSEAYNESADKVYLIDVQPEFKKLIPSHILDEAVELSSIHRFSITHDSNRMTIQEAMDFHEMGEERIELLKKTAKLVITSRLHAASPCLAMGIPVIMTKHDDRFGFIDRFLPSYTDWENDVIDWNPLPVDIEKEKDAIKQAFFDRIRYEEKRINLFSMWDKKQINVDVKYEPQVMAAIKSVVFNKRDFKYAVLGIISSISYFIPDVMKELYPEAELVCGIDSYVTRDFFGTKVMKPSEISSLSADVIIITAVQGAYQSAQPYLENRPLIFVKGKKATVFGFKADEKE